MRLQIRKYWRLYLLAFALTISLLIVFSPVIPGYDIGAEQDVEDPSIDQEIMSLQYGIDLVGGTQIRAPLVGITAENVDIGSNDPERVEELIADEFENIRSTDVVYRPTSSDRDEPALEVRHNITINEFETVLESHDVQFDTVRAGVTSETQNEMVEVTQTKLNEAGLSGGEVRMVSSGTLEDQVDLILISVPDVNREQTIDILRDRGEVRIDIYHRNFETDSYENKTTLVRDDFRTIGTAQSGSEGQQPHVPVTLTESGAEGFRQDALDTGLASQSGSTCRFESNRENTEPCLLTVVDGQPINSFGMAPSLASAMQSEAWVNDPSFILQTSSFSEAQEVVVNLRAGALPTNIDLENGETIFVSSDQGDEFRLLSFIIGALAALTVALIVGTRYKNLKIAIPMLFIAFTEIVILMAIASILSYPIDIAVIAGFIAVIGTGVDDLIIITDRVMKSNTASRSSKIFKMRFKQALWIILGAAGTTILALLPLSILNLQDLQGLAIFTILGIIAGVLITRPAYGDILRYFFTEDYDS